MSIDDQGRDDALRAGIRRAEASIASGAPLRSTLAVLTSTVEALGGRGAVASILLLDGEGLLRDGASPNLPSDYLQAIDRLRPDVGVGTCAAAAATGQRVYTPDFTADDRWAELRHLPLAIGFLGAWSEPIKTAHGRVVGTFGTYFPERRLPTDAEIAVVQALLPVAARAIERA